MQTVILYIEWINNKALLCSTGNYIQYLVMNHNGTGKKEKNIEVILVEKAFSLLLEDLYFVLLFMAH